VATSRDRKQVVLLLGLLCLSCFVFGCLVVLIGAWPLGKAWITLTALGSVGILSGVYVFAQGTVPDAQVILRVVDYIAEVRLRGVDSGCESYKGKLRFYLPPDWQRKKAGREGWLIYPKGLGVPLIFSVWAFEVDSAFESTSTEDLACNAEDLGHRHGFKLVSDSVRPCEVAGQKAIEYKLKAGGVIRVLGYLWRFEDNDYEFLVEAYSSDHLQMIHPAIEEFLQGMFMW